MRLVVAHYNEDLKWLEKLPSDINVDIESSSRYVEHCASAYRACGERLYWSPIKDVGQESYAYANFIATSSMWNKLLLPHYDTHFVFVQGNPFDHAADNAVNDPKDFIAWLREFKANPQPFKLIGERRECPVDERLHFRYRFRPRSPLVEYALDAVPDTDQFNPRTPMLDLWRYLLPEEPPPSKWVYSWGNQFAASREVLQRRPVGFWQRMCDVLKHDPKPLEATAMERMWPAILGVNP